MRRMRRRAPPPRPRPRRHRVGLPQLAGARPSACAPAVFPKDRARARLDPNGLKDGWGLLGVRCARQGKTRDVKSATSRGPSSKAFLRCPAGNWLPIGLPRSPAPAVYHAPVHRYLLARLRLMPRLLNGGTLAGGRSDALKRLCYLRGSRRSCYLGVHQALGRARCICRVSLFRSSPAGRQLGLLWFPVGSEGRRRCRQSSRSRQPKWCTD
jgi:hypothetical protein